MESSQKNSSPLKLWMFVFAIVFALSTVFSPKLFAQENSGNSKSAAKVSQYMQLINSVFGFVLQNYVDEVDPEVVYAGALKGIMDSLEDPYSTYLDTTSMRSLNDTTVEVLAKENNERFAYDSFRRFIMMFADVVIGVPDSGIEAAMGYAKESKIPYDIVFTKSKYIGRTFIQNTQDKRKKLVNQKFKQRN